MTAGPLSGCLTVTPAKISHMARPCFAVDLSPTDIVPSFEDGRGWQKTHCNRKLINVSRPRSRNCSSGYFCARPKNPMLRRPLVAAIGETKHLLARLEKRLHSRATAAFVSIAPIFSWSGCEPNWGFKQLNPAPRRCVHTRRHGINGEQCTRLK
jgi:hypothetical protein